MSCQYCEVVCEGRYDQLLDVGADRNIDSLERNVSNLSVERGRQGSTHPEASVVLRRGGLEHLVVANAARVLALEFDPRSTS